MSDRSQDDRTDGNRDRFFDADAKTVISQGFSSSLPDDNEPSWENSTQPNINIPLPSDIPTLDCPSRVGIYPIKSPPVGRGGIGVVLRGYDAEFNRMLAIKLLRYEHKDNPDLASRFLTEAQIMGQLQHPNIPPVHDLGTSGDGRPYFSMKLIKGQTLGQMLNQRRDKLQDLPKYVDIFEKVCEALAYAHSKGIINRDLKPANIMVGVYSFGEVYVLDWGMAKLVKSPTTDDNEESDSTLIALENDSPVDFTIGGRGTFGFMPPEQIIGGYDQVDERCDVFGLGAILHVILTGKAPYTVDSQKEAVAKATSGELDADPELLNQCKGPSELIELTKRCLQAHREQRPKNAGEVAEAVSRYQAKVQEESRRKELRAAQELVRRQERRKRRWLAWGVVLSSLAALLVAFISYRILDDKSAENKTIRKKQFESHLDLVEDHLKRDDDIELAKKRLKEAQQLAPLLGRAEEERVDIFDRQVELKRQLDEIFSRKAALTTVANRQFVYPSAEKEYLKLFRAHKYWNAFESPLALAARIQKSILSDQIILAFDDWAAETKSAARRKRLHSVIEHYDPDFRELRDEIQKPDFLRDQNKMRTLLNKIPGRRIPTRYVLSLIRQSRRLGPQALPMLQEVWKHAQREFKSRVMLGSAYLKFKQFERAIKEIEEAWIKRKESPLANNNYGCAFFFQGEFKTALSLFRKAIKLLDEKHPLYAPIKEHIAMSDEYLKLDNKLSGKDVEELKSLNATEQLKLADLCHRCKHQYYAAYLFAVAAFEQNPKFAEDQRFAFRFQAIRSALLAAAGKGNDGKELREMERAMLRRQALKWFTAELKYWEKATLAAEPGSKITAPTTVAAWLTEPDFAGVREAEALGRLSPEEQESWEQFWNEVNLFVNRPRLMMR